MKYYKHAIRDISNSTGLTMNEINVLVFMYDYEFFTSDHLAEALYQSPRKFKNKILYPLQKREWIEKAFDKTKVNEMSFSEALFHERSHYKNRYTITQRARLTVQKFYRKLEGQEEIAI
tara:strand:- start:907 stop:1263 length:357 start_codon:yes stop_codon:yes gene_type:complete